MFVHGEHAANSGAPDGSLGRHLGRYFAWDEHQADPPDNDLVTSWATFEAEAPEMARFARERLTAHKHVLLATLRADGSPRISGIEVTIGAGEIWLGSMTASRKVHDLRRDPRLALHSNSDDPPAFVGDARISGNARFVDDADDRAPYIELLGGESPGDFELIRIDIEEVMTIAPGPSGDRLIYEIWRPGQPVKSKERL